MHVRVCISVSVWQVYLCLYIYLCQRKCIYCDTRVAWYTWSNLSCERYRSLVTLEGATFQCGIRRGVKHFSSRLTRCNGFYNRIRTYRYRNKRCVQYIQLEIVSVCDGCWRTATLPPCSGYFASQTDLLKKCYLNTCRRTIGCLCLKKLQIGIWRGTLPF